MHTIEDIFSLPDGARAELVHGQLIMMAPPSRQHQDIAGRLYAAILQHINDKHGNCRPYMASFAIFLDDEDTYVEPDVSVICDPRKLDDRGCHGAPEFIIEVVSPSSRRMDYYTKLTLYRDAGVREYWIVDPAKETILVYLMEESQAPTIYPFTDSIPVSIFQNFSITLSELL